MCREIRKQKIRQSGKVNALYSCHGHLFEGKTLPLCPSINNLLKELFIGVRSPVIATDEVLCDFCSNWA